MDEQGPQPSVVAMGTHPAASADYRLVLRALEVAGNAAQLASLLGLRNKNGPNVWKQNTSRGAKLSPVKRMMLERVIAEHERPVARRPLLIWTRDQRVAFGQRLRVARHDRLGLRRETFAHQLGIPLDVLAAFEDGTMEPPAGFVARLALLADLDLYTLLDVPHKATREQRVHGTRREMPFPTVRLEHERRRNIRRFVDLLKCSEDAKHLSDQLATYTTIIRDELMIRNEQLDPRIVLQEVELETAPMVGEAPATPDEAEAPGRRALAAEAGTPSELPSDW